MTYDDKCADLARFMLKGRVPDDVLEGMVADLAQAIQTTIEDFDNGTAAVAVKRELIRRKTKLTT